LSRDPSDRPTIAKVIDSLQQILVSSNTAQVPDLANPSSFDNFSTTCITLEDEPDLGTVYFNQGMAHLKEKEYKLGFQLIEKAANQGNVSALCKLGEMYELGCGVAKSIPWALLHYQKAAAGLCVTAYKHLGRIYFKGSDVKQDYEVALEWYLKAADEGDHKAQFIVGEMYEKGLGVQVDYMVSFEWHLKAILNGSQKSNWCLRQLLEKGFIKNIQETKVFEWFTKLAAEGNSVAQCELGIWYEKGLAVTQNSKSAFDYYAMAANANSANTLAVYKMNSFYEKGSFEPDSDSPLDLPKEDQVQGSSPLFMVGSAEDQNYVITKDMDDAPDWFKEASSDTANL
jgi:TPR repeat protein